jgi:hypothetical protein
VNEAVRSGGFPFGQGQNNPPSLVADIKQKSTAFFGNL